MTNGEELTKNNLNTVGRRNPSAMGRLGRSFANAFWGMVATFRSERNFRIHVVAMCPAIALGWYLGLTALEWGLVVFAIGSVLMAELFNTAIERLGDKVAQGQYDRLVKIAKDASAAAVLISALVALVIGVIFLFIPLAQKIL